MMYLGNQAVGLNSWPTVTELSLNTANVQNAYVSTTINQTPSFTESNFTYAYVNAISVKQNLCYLIRITNSNSPASTSTRNSVIVVDNKVKEVIPVYTNASTTNSFCFIPKNTGSLILCVDKNYTNIKIYEIVLP